MSSISVWRRLCESLPIGRTQVWMLTWLCPHLYGLVLGGWGLFTQRCSSPLSKEGVGHIEVYHHFVVTHRYTFTLIIIYKVKVCENPASSKSLSTIFSSSICSLGASVSHDDNSHSSSHLFTMMISVLVLCDQGSLMLLLQEDDDSEGSDDG